MDDEPAATGGERETTNGYVRRLSGTETRGAVTVVGVVHDHPASVRRVREVVGAADPDVVAVELAPLALPLFEHYADDVAPPERGGEMSAALQAAADSRVVGIDGPSLGFLRTLASVCREDGATPRVLWRTLRRMGSATRDVVRCRIGSVRARLTGADVALDEPVDHDVGPADDAAVVAADERRQVRTAQSVLSALESPAHAEYCDRARDRHMTRRLASLRAEGDVVAVVGVGHLAAVTEGLRAGADG